MNNIEKIKAKIKRLKAENSNIRCQHNEKYCTGYDDAFRDLLPFIDSMSEEKPSEELEEEIKNYFEGLWSGIETPEQCNTDLHFTPPAIIRLVRHFTEWQKQRDAELIEIAYNDGITIGKTKQKEQLMNDSEEDALLLERAWLTLDGFGHEELAERLRKLKEKYANKM